MGMEPNPLMDGQPMPPQAGPPMDGGGMPPAGQPPMGGPPMGMPQAPAPKPEWTDEALQLLMDDFDMDSMDIAIGADPKSVTDMQRMMRAQYLGTFLENPVMAAGMDAQEIKRRMLEAAQMDDIDKLFAKGPDPVAQVAEAQAKATVKDTEAAAVLKMQQAEKARQEANDVAFQRGITAGTGANAQDTEAERSRMDAAAKDREFQIKQAELDLKKRELDLKLQMEADKREHEIGLRRMELDHEAGMQQSEMDGEQEAEEPQEKGEDKSSQLMDLMRQVIDGQQATLKAQAAKKRVVRDEAGRVVGLETVNEE